MRFRRVGPGSSTAGCPPQAVRNLAWADVYANLYIVAIGFLAIAISLKAFRRGERWAWYSKLAKYLPMLEQHEKIERIVIRGKPPKLVEYRRVGKLSKPSEHLFQKLAENVKTSETVKVTLTDVETGRGRVLMLDKDNNWIPIQEE